MTVFPELLDGVLKLLNLEFEMALMSSVILLPEIRDLIDTVVSVSSVEAGEITFVDFPGDYLTDVVQKSD